MIPSWYQLTPSRGRSVWSQPWPSWGGGGAPREETPPGHQSYTVWRSLSSRNHYVCVCESVCCVCVRVCVCVRESVCVLCVPAAKPLSFSAQNTHLCIISGVSSVSCFCNCVENSVPLVTMKLLVTLSSEETKQWNRKIEHRHYLLTLQSKVEQKQVIKNFCFSKCGRTVTFLCKTG